MANDDVSARAEATYQAAVQIRARTVVRNTPGNGVPCLGFGFDRRPIADSVRDTGVVLRPDAVSMTKWSDRLARKNGYVDPTIVLARNVT